MRRLQFPNYLMVLSYDPLVARTRAGRSSYAFIHVSAYGPEFSRQRATIERRELDEEGFDGAQVASRC